MQRVLRPALLLLEGRGRGQEGGEEGLGAAVRQHGVVIP